MRQIAKYYVLSPKLNAATLLAEAELWLDATQTSGQTLPNSGTGGSALDATLGSSLVPEPTTNDPMFLAHTGTNYLYLPGVAGNYASTPDSAALDITGDIDIRVKLSLSTWTPAIQLSHLCGKIVASGSQKSYGLFLRITGQLYLATNPIGGGADVIAQSTVPTGLAPGATKWVRATLDVDDGAGNRVYNFYLSDDGITWNQLGSTITAVGTTSIFNSVSPIEIGAGFSGSLNITPEGEYYRAQVLNGINGTVVFDADFTTGITSGAQTTFIESSTNAATVTINRSTSGRKAVAVVQPTLLFGTDDYMFVADNDLLDFGASDSVTAIAAFRSWNTQGTNDTLIAKKANTTDTTQGWSLSNGSSTALSGQAQIGDGAEGDTATSASRTVGALSTVAMVRDVAADTLTVFTNAAAGTPVADTTTGSLANSEELRIGRLSGAGTEYADMEWFGAAVWRRALSAGEIKAIVDYYGAA